MKDRKKVLFLTDSLGLPRLLPEPVYDDQVWTSMVAEELRDSFSFFYYTNAGLHTSAIVSTLNNQLGAFRPDVIVFQVGIVDCAPRSMKENERKVLERLPKLLREPIKKRIKTNYGSIVLKRDITYVSREAFENNLKLIKKFYERTEFVVIPIAPATEGYIEKNPLICRNIDDYNAILHRIFGDKFCDDLWSASDIDHLFLSDHHHLSVSGNEHLSLHVVSELLRRLSC